VPRDSQLENPKRLHGACRERSRGLLENDLDPLPVLNQRWCSSAHVVGAAGQVVLNVVGEAEDVPARCTHDTPTTWGGLLLFLGRTQLSGTLNRLVQIVHGYVEVHEKQVDPRQAKWLADAETSESLAMPIRGGLRRSYRKSE
jgi:hypothetical protein